MNPPHWKAARTETRVTNVALSQQSSEHKNTGGFSQDNDRNGFHPAFIDAVTGTIYHSRFADGRLAPFHLLEGLPEDVIAERDAHGRVAAAKSSVVADFVRDGRFFSREEAASVVSAVRRTASNAQARLQRGVSDLAAAVTSRGRAA